MDPVLILVIVPLGLFVLFSILPWLFETRRYRRGRDGAMVEIDSGDWFSAALPAAMMIAVRMMVMAAGMAAIEQGSVCRSNAEPCHQSR